MAADDQPRARGARGMRTFFVIWLGQLISVLGSGLTSFALGVWIFSETGQATPFALAVLFGTLPRLLLAPVAGSLADRWSRRWILILADIGNAVVTTTVLVLILIDGLQIWNIYLVSAVGSICSAFQEPAYMSSVTMLVPKQQLTRASGMMNVAQSLSVVVSPLLAGFLFGAIGLQGIILIDFATFFFAIGALLVVRIPQPKHVEIDGGRQNVLKDAAFGWRYLRQRPGLFSLLWYFAFVNFIINLSMVLLTPLVLSFADAEMLGVVQAVSGVGMLAGSVAMSAWGGPKRRIVGVLGFVALTGAGMAVAGLQPSVWVIAAGLFVLLFSAPFSSGCSQAIFQSKVEPGIQGRVFAVRSAISQALMPLAFLIAGPLADGVFNPLLQPGGELAGTIVAALFGVGDGRGIGLMFSLSGLLAVLATVWIALNPRVRRIETELPDVAIEEDAVVVPTALEQQAVGQ